MVYFILLLLFLAYKFLFSKMERFNLPPGRTGPGYRDGSRDGASSCNLSCLSANFFFITSSLPNVRHGPAPGPLSRPFVGHLHLMKPPIHRLLLQRYTDNDNYGPIFSLRFGSRRVVVITSPSPAKRRHPL
ncbi:Cytochrome P450 81F1 [Raphanus sativus]|nr:Cytochrome P450 81F1 [Raphanus sativus]